MSFDDFLAPALRARGEAVTHDNHHGHAPQARLSGFVARNAPHFVRSELRKRRS